MAIVSDAVGSQIFGMSADEASGNRSNAAYEVLSCIQDCQQWKAEVRSGIMGGEKYFLLKMKSGNSEPVYEKYVMKALGIVRLVEK